MWISMARLVAGVVAFVSMAGCIATHQVTRVDPKSGLLPTSFEVKAKHIKIYVPSSLVHNIKFVVLRAGSGGTYTDEFGSFVKGSLGELGLKPVVDRDELTRMVLVSALRDSVGNVTDPVALANISEEIGPFLLIDAIQVHQGNAWFETRIRVTDPERAQVVLDVHQVRSNMLDLDAEINFPMLNVLKRWLDDSRKLPAEYREPRPEAPATDA